MAAGGLSEFARVVRAAGHSWAGVKAVWRNEAAFRLEIVLFCVLCPLGLWLGDDGVERALLVGSWVFVIVMELVNSAVEAVVDRIGLERHELSGRAKDIGSATVAVGILLTVAVWLLVLLG